MAITFASAKTFAEFMNASKSSNDAIERFTEAVRELTDAMGGMNEGVERISKTTLPAFKQRLDLITASFGNLTKAITLAGTIGTASLIGMAKVASPASFIQFNMAVTDLSGVLGTMFAPALLKVAFAVREVANYLWNLTPSTKAVIAATAAMAVAMTLGFTAIRVAVISTTAAFAAFNTVSGGVLAIVGLITTGLVGLATKQMMLGEDTEWFGETLGELWKIAQKVWQGISVVSQAAWTATKPVFAAFYEAGMRLATWLEPIALVFKDIGASIVASFETLAPTIQTLSDFVWAVLASMAEGIGAAFFAILKAIEYTIDQTTRAFIGLTVIMEAIRNGTIFSGGVLDKINEEIDAYEKRKEDARKQFDKPTTKDKEKKEAAPHFNNDPKIMDVATAKQQFWTASLKASAGADDPAKRAADAAQKQNTIGEQTNAILNQIQAAFGQHVPFNNGLKK